MRDVEAGLSLARGHPHHVGHFEMDWRSCWHRSAFVLVALALATQLRGVSVTSLGTIETPELTAPSAGVQSRTLHDYARLPLSFVENQGQVDKDVAYYAQGSGYSFAFKRDRVLMSFAQGRSADVDQSAADGASSGAARELVPGVTLALEFVDPNNDVSLRARNRTPGTVNYLIGDDPAQWHTGLRSYREIVYENLWDGIDMVFYGSQGKLKYDLVVSAQGSPDDIALAYAGASGLSLDADGNLLINTDTGTLEEVAPVSYQWAGRARHKVASRFMLSRAGDGSEVVSFALASRYDPNRPVLIDPGLDYATFLGGGGVEFGLGVAVDESGSAYVTGITLSPDFPTTPGAFNPRVTLGVFVTKFDLSGSDLVYSTFLGEGNGNDVAVDESGSAYVTGSTGSAEFPTTPGAFDTTLSGAASADAFVTKLSPDGSALAYSTYLGGGFDVGEASPDDVGEGIAVDASGNAYVAGRAVSDDFPTTPGAFNPRGEGGFVTKLDPSGSDLVYSTYIAGARFVNDVAVDEAGDVYITGDTGFERFPTTPEAFDTTFNGPCGERGCGLDGFVTKLNAAGSALVYSTFLGGSGSDDRGSGVALDGTGNAYVTGQTGSADFPTTPGAFDTTFKGADAFVTKLAPDGSGLTYSTYLGGAFEDAGGAIVVDPTGRAYVAGGTGSADFPTTPGSFDASFGGVFDAFVARLTADGSRLDYSTYLGGRRYDDAGVFAGGIALDPAGNAYVTGRTGSSGFATTPGAFDGTFNNVDAFVAKLPAGGPTVRACLGIAATIVGTRDDDLLRGTSAADVIVGLGGDDTVLGMRGDDRVCGGPGRDRLIGLRGNDTMSGGADNDRLIGRRGDDSLRGDDGNDFLDGRTGQDKLIGGRGSDSLNGGDKNDSLDSRDGVTHNDSNHGGDGVDCCRVDSKDIVNMCEP